MAGFTEESGDRKATDNASAGPERTEDGLLEGVVGEKARKDVTVFTSKGNLKCSVRGKFYGEGSVPLVGDKVLVRTTGPEEGVVEEILPRRTVLSRRVGEGRRAKRHFYCANVEIVVIVCAAKAPPLRPALIDRLIVTAVFEDLTPLICLNKIDQDADGEARAVMDVYKELGYEVFETSALTGEGVERLGKRLRNHVSVLSGHSGVGKTSLLKKLVPGFSRRTRELTKRARGRHATVEVYLVPLPGGGYLVDTPGFREFTVWGVAPEDIGSYYPEFLEFASKCRFNNCLHRSEPGCSVLEAVREGKIHPLRYKNYLRLLETHGAE